MYRAEVTHTDDFAFSVKTSSVAFVIDAKESALTPLDALLAGLGSCIGVYIRKYAEGAKLALEHFTVTVEAELSKETPVSFKVIKASVDLKGALDERRKNALLAFIKNCPVHNTLKGNPLIEMTLT